MASLSRSATYSEAEFSRLLEETMNAGKREEILGRIREALRIAAPRRYNGHGPAGSRAPQAKAEPRAWLPAVSPDAAAQLALFQKNCVQLKTDFRLVSGAEEAAKVLSELCREYSWSLAATHRNVLLDPIVQSLDLELVYVEQRPEVAALEKASVGITGCDALVAQTGSILLTARSAGGRALSVLPPHHIVIAKTSQVVPDLPGAFDLLYARYGENYPSFTTFITGPSRTGDIERILVLGAHGPRILTVILLSDENKDPSL
jgi:L-lactate dehydrogenase complex protein LldG